MSARRLSSAAGPEGGLDIERARAVLGAPALTWLVERLRQRVERGAVLRGRVAKVAPSADERRALDVLMGRPPSTGRRVSLRLEALEERLRHGGIGPDLRSVLEAVTGPLVDRRAQRQQRDEEWQALRAQTEGRLRATGADPRLLDWLADRRTLVLLRRASRRDPDRGRQVLARALAVIDKLPADEVPLAELAAATVGDSHALDPGRTFAILVAEAAARLGGLGSWSDIVTRHGRGAEAWKRVWESVGVAKDDLSASVLVHRLPAVDDGLCARVLAVHALAGEPCRLTTGALRRHPPVFDPRRVPRVHVCENPAVVAAASRRLGTGSAPLVCADGRPTLAVHTLLERLASSGVMLQYHGDFDWAGLDIASRLMARHGMVPWRFGLDDYLGAPAGPPLGTPPKEAVDTPWAPGLAAALESRGVAVEEEQVLEVLLADLEPGDDRLC